MPATACPDTCDSWDFAARYFGDCVCSRRDALSFVLGCVSIVAWGLAELPQIIANWRNRSSEGVSLAFIATWLTGDAFNLVGCAVSPTLPTQLYTAMLYTSTTVVLIAQHLHYNNRRSDAATKRETEGAEDVHGRSHRLGDIENGEGDVWNDDAARGTDARPLLGRHRRDASGDASDDENKSSASAAAFESVGSIFGTTPGSARTFALLGSVPHPSGSYSGSHPRAVRSHGRAHRRSLGSLPPRPQSHDLPPLSSSGEDGGTSNGDGGRGRGWGGARSGLTTSLAAAAATGSSLSVFSALANADAGRGFESASRRLLETSSEFESASRRLLETSSEFIRAPLVRAPTWLGPALGWTMTAIYLSGRVPQIARNHARGSVEGLSVSMFVLAVVGNATYLGSILARSTRWVTVAPNMPWIVDAGMCLVMDAVILAQSAWYGGCGGWRGRDQAAGSTRTPPDSGYASDDESGSDESLLDPV